MANIGIIGSGNVGANTAFFVAEKGVADVTLYDIQDGLSTGKALDMMEAAPVRGYRTRIKGSDSTAGVKKNDIVIVSAGGVRQPGMKREDLFEANRSIIDSVAADLVEYTGVVIMVTEPVDALTAYFVEKTKLPRTKVMGLGGLLDSTRLRYLIAHELGVTMDDVSALVVGRHSDAMIPLARYTCVSGVPVTQLMSAERLTELFDETKTAGDVIVTMAQRASAYYGPSAAASDLAEAVCRDSRRVLPVSVTLAGEFGVSGVAMTLPAIVGRNGIHRIILPELSEDEVTRFSRSAADLATMTKSA